MVLGPALADDRVLAVANRARTHRVLTVSRSGYRRPNALTPTVISVPAVDDHPGRRRASPVRPAPQRRSLRSAAATLLALTETAPSLPAAAGRHGIPGAGAGLRSPAGGAAVEVETWSVPSAALAGILAALVQVGLPGPGHPGRRQHRDRLRRRHLGRSPAPRTPPTSPSSAAGAAISPPRTTPSSATDHSASRPIQAHPCPAHTIRSRTMTEIPIANGRSAAATVDAVPAPFPWTSAAPRCR